MMTPNQKLLRNLDWNLLYTFLIIVEESSITGAARRLSLSQPSVSNALKRLENELNLRLIERKKGQFSLTNQGLLVYEYASSVGDILNHMADHFVGQEEQLYGEVDIQIASHLHCPALDQTLTDFHKQYPNVLLSINTQPSAQIITNVALGHTRIGLSNKSINQTGLWCELIGHERLAFFCGPSHPLYQQKDIPLSTLKGLDYVSFESDQPGEGLSGVAQFRAEHQCWGKLVAISSNEEEVRRLIIAGVGFGALTMEGSRAYIEQHQLWQLPPYSELLMSKVYLVTQDNQPLPIAEQLFVAMLRKTVSAMSATN